MRDESSRCLWSGQVEGIRLLMTLQQLKYIITVAETGNITDAAEKLFISQPSLTSAIHSIEKEMNGNIRKEKKNLWATPTGVELIGLIREELLKSAELTGLWEKKLRQIESHQYEARTFIAELKEMVNDVVKQVLSDNSNRRVPQEPEESNKKGKSKK